MNKRLYSLLRFYTAFFLASFSKFFAYFLFYLAKKIKSASLFFENNKNNLVRLFTAKRGKYNRPFLHVATFGVLAFGVILTPFLASTFPVFSPNTNISQSLASQSINVGDNVFQTRISQKPRDKAIDYTVQKGDTISTIAEKFGISENTVRWENDLVGDNITVGDSIKVLPVTGMSYKVQKGDTVYSIAKKLATDPQKIVDFPFNDFANPETFSLVDGQFLVVPDAIKPSEQPYIRPQQVYIATGPVSVSSAGFTWPLRGLISQFAAWYHMALDITSPVGTPIIAAQTGTVTRVSIGTWDSGYGNNVEVSAGEYGTHYAHMSAVNVNAGDQVTAGKTVIGWVGLTGRTTGAHLHFEVKRNGVLLNPLSYLQ
ncbi:MAG TPA: M23 family metallopeptidase [Patescibacteria group bacterium]|nr:M23 family metallopeptidase [Patescibacteria group bacterium]